MIEIEIRYVGIDPIPSSDWGDGIKAYKPGPTHVILCLIPTNRERHLYAGEADRFLELVNYGGALKAIEALKPYADADGPPSPPLARTL